MSTLLERLKQENQLEEDDIAFLEHIQAEAETPLGERSAIHKRWTAFQERYSSNGNRLTKADLYAADRLVLEMASSEELHAQAPGLYKRYCEERGEAVDPSDLAMKPEAKSTQDDECLRAHLLQLLRSLHWGYTFGPLREKRRLNLIHRAMWLIVGATLASGLIFACLDTIGNKQHPFLEVVTAVVYAGILGGSISCIRRLGAVPIRGDALSSIYALRNSRYVLYFAPLTGAVFAVITMLLFIGEIMSGGIFPKFVWSTSVPPNIAAWHWLLPDGQKSYALLFLWCFIAGFAEQFIPDTLGQLTQRANGQGRTTTGGPAQPNPLTTVVEKI